MKKKFVLEGLDCAHCASKIETAISKLDGVKEASVNFMIKKLIIDGEDEKISEIIQEAERIIKDMEPDVVMKKA
ncbi:cation transporter [Tissierella praeacuta]|uniref:cation transporter n=1 Tax=Tissierella praeacuta TaxID=43131 RepID=UPI003340EE7A